MVKPEASKTETSKTGTSKSEIGEPDFCENLRLLCSFEASVSEACRAMGINRQQFSKYLSGTSTPSHKNMRKICDYFEVRLADLYLPHDEFQLSDVITQRQEKSKNTSFSHSPLSKAFQGQTRPLSKYLGAYLSYFHSFSWKGKILCALTVLTEKNGTVESKTIERCRDPEDNTLFLSKYAGQAAWLGNRIFVVEYQELAKDAIVETVLYPMSRSRLTYMRGVTFGVSSQRRHPYMAKSVWKYLGPNADLKEALKMVGLYDPESRIIDPQVRKYLGNSQVIGGSDIFNFEL